MYSCRQLNVCKGVDVLVKSLQSARGQVTSFLTSQTHQKFFQVSFGVTKDDNSESISAWNEKKPPVCPRGKRFHTRQPLLNFRHSFAPFFVRKRRLSFYSLDEGRSAHQRVLSQYAAFSPQWYDSRGAVCQRRACKVAVGIAMWVSNYAPLPSGEIIITVYGSSSDNVGMI